jgi:hypothetical protein
MPYPQHWRLAFGGSLYGSEDWSCNLKLGKVGALQGATINPETLIDDCVTDIGNFLKGIYSGLSPAADLRWVKLNEIGPEGRYADPSRTVARYLTGAAIVKNTSSTAAPLPQAALAFTLHSARTRGPLSKGRIFIPTYFSPSSLTEPRIAEGTAASAAGAMAAFVRALNNWPGTDTSGLAVVNVSPGGRGLPDGGMDAVTAVSVGRVIDTQRRRRAAFQEAPQRVAV